MKIAMMAYTPVGGAGRAAMRLLDGLNRLPDVACDMFVRHNVGEQKHVRNIHSQKGIFQYIQEHFFKKNIYPGHPIMSLMYSGSEQKYLDSILPYDIVHLHWVANFVSAESLPYMVGMGKKLVWTFHDMNPMTGGCHYSSGCYGYERDCADCPQLRENPYHITKTMLSLKKKYIPSDLVVVTPSRWLADCARRSSIFCNHRIEVIPYSIDLSGFKAIDKVTAKRTMGMNPMKKTILYCAENIDDLHKGYAYFLQSLQYAKEHTPLKKNADNGGIEVLLMGNGGDTASHDIARIGMACRPLGFLAHDEAVNLAYAAADVTVLPSLEDNYPNVMLESLASGTPVAGFRTGGIPDLIQDGLTGYVVPAKDAEALGCAISHILMADGWQGKCRAVAEKKLALEIQAQQYKALYEDIMLHGARFQSRGRKAFSLPTESTQALAPYSYAALEYLSNLGQNDFWKLIFADKYEEIALRYGVLRMGSAMKYGEQSIAIWGTGVLGAKFLQKLLAADSDYQGKVKGFFDSAPKSETFAGYPVLDANEWASMNLQVIVIGSLKYEAEIYHKMEGHNGNIKILRLSRMEEVM